MVDSCTSDTWTGTKRAVTSINGIANATRCATRQGPSTKKGTELKVEDLNPKDRKDLQLYLNRGTKKDKYNRGPVEERTLEKCPKLGKKIVFDSNGEMTRWLELIQLEKSEQIRMLERQVPYVLVDMDDGLTKYKLTYKADYTYYERLVETINGQAMVVWRSVVEDFKGWETPLYKKKRKLMLDKFGIRIREAR